MKFSPVSFAAAVILVKPSDAKLSTPQSGLQVLSDEQAAIKLEGDAGYSWDSPMSISLFMEAEKSSMTVGVAATTDTDTGISSSKSGNSAKGNKQCRQFRGGIQGDNQSYGNMFTIKATQDIVISGFTYYSSTGWLFKDSVTIWEKCGDYEGFENDSTAWNKIQDVEGVNTMGLTPLPKLETPIFVAKDSIRSFHISTAKGIAYTNGVQEGSIYTQDSSITFYEGRGCSGVFGCNFSPRVWNGYIDYCVVSPSKSGKATGVENTCPPPPTFSPSVTVAPSVSVAPIPFVPTYSPTSP